VRYRATVERSGDGRWTARCPGGPGGAIEARAAGRDDALARLRDEIRFRLEYCPCSAVGDDYVELEVVDGDLANRSPRHGADPRRPPG